MNFTQEELDSEQWSKIPSLPPSLEVSTLGRIREFITPTEVVIMKTRHTRDGQEQFGYRSKTYTVHRIVAETFLDPPADTRFVVSHKNGLKGDNRVENLEWLLPQQNLHKSYAWSTDRRPKLYCNELDMVFGSMRAAAAYVSVPQDVISRGMTEGKAVCGYTFRYIERDDPLLIMNHPIYYLPFDDIFEVASNVNSPEEFTAQVKSKMSDNS